MGKVCIIIRSCKTVINQKKSFVDISCNAWKYTFCTIFNPSRQDVQVAPLLFVNTLDLDTLRIVSYVRHFSILQHPLFLLLLIYRLKIASHDRMIFLEIWESFDPFDFQEGSKFLENRLRKMPDQDLDDSDFEFHLQCCEILKINK